MTTLFIAVSLLLGLILGVAIASLWVRSRVAVEIERAKSEGAVELSAARERANRIPALEVQLAQLLEAEQSHRAEILRLTEEQAERRQLLRSMEEQLVESKAQLSRTEDRLSALSSELTASKERQAALASESARVPGLELRINESDSRVSALNDELTAAKESLGSVATELRSERESVTSLRAGLTASRVELGKAQEAAVQLAIDKTDLTTRLAAEREQAAEKLGLLNDAKQTLSDQFKALANDILEEKSRRFAEQNQTNLGQLLDPLKGKHSRNPILPPLT